MPVEDNAVLTLAEPGRARPLLDLPRELVGVEERVRDGRLHAPHQARRQRPGGLLRPPDAAHLAHAARDGPARARGGRLPRRATARGRPSGATSARPSPTRARRCSATSSRPATVCPAPRRRTGARRPAAVGGGWPVTSPARLARRAAAAPGRDDAPRPSTAAGCLTAPARGRPTSPTSTTSAEGWSAELEALHVESSLEHPIDVLTRAAAVAALRGAGLGARPTLVNVGCSSGHLLADLRAEWPGATLAGVNAEAAGLPGAHAAVPDAALLHASATDLPFADGWPMAWWRSTCWSTCPTTAPPSPSSPASCAPAARAVVVVPANPRLYDYYDAHLRHERRYARGEVPARPATAGLAPVAETAVGQRRLPRLLGGQDAQPAPAPRPGRGPRAGRARHRPLSALAAGAARIPARGRAAAPGRPAAPRHPPGASCWSARRDGLPRHRRRRLHRQPRHSSPRRGAGARIVVYDNLTWGGSSTSATPSTTTACAWRTAI